MAGLAQTFPAVCAPEAQLVQSSHDPRACVGRRVGACVFDLRFILYGQKEATMRRSYLPWAVALALCLAPAQALSQGAKTETGMKSATAQPGAAKTAAALSKADEETLISMEREAWEVIKKKDWKAFDRLLTPDYVWIDDGGIIAGRTASVKYFTGTDLAGYTMQEVKVTAFGPGVAFVTYSVTEQGSFQGQAIPAKPFYVGSGYVKRGGKWVNFFTQETPSR